MARRRQEFNERKIALARENNIRERQQMRTPKIPTAEEEVMQHLLDVDPCVPFYLQEIEGCMKYALLPQPPPEQRVIEAAKEEFGEDVDFTALFAGIR